MTDVLYSLAEEIGRRMLARRHKLVIAESCTGGWIAKCVTDVAGSSQWFDCGFVTYSNEAKVKLLGLSDSLLARYGAVSQEAVQHMASGALAKSRAQLAVAVSGIAGPGGGTEDKPVGTVCFAWHLTGKACQTETRELTGNRRMVREKAVIIVFEGILSVYDRDSA